MKFGVIVFPGSNCDHDAFHAVSANLGQPVEYIWHDSASLGEVDAVIECGLVNRFHNPVGLGLPELRKHGARLHGPSNDLIREFFCCGFHR